jgi:hypothetical protein
MLKTLYQIWKDFWKWLNCLPKQTIAIVSIGSAIIASMGFALFMLLQINESVHHQPVMAELSAMRTEFAQNDSIIMREIRSVAEQVNGVDTKVSKVILIVAANSNSDLIRHLVPYLENVATKQDIYSFVLDIQRDIQLHEQQQRDALKHGISVQKKSK